MSCQAQPGNGGDAAASPDEQLLTALSLHPQEWALFLDIDGTLLDLAETPDSIIVPPSLPADLDALSRKLGGALALVTGRAVAFVDPLFSPFRFPVAGLHGAERRDAAGRLHQVAVPPAFEAVKQAIALESAALPGILVEDKGAAIAAHYRQAPGHEAHVEALMRRHLEKAGPDWTLQRGKMVLEIRPAAANKGQAVEAFLDEQPFRGRRPLSIGDDVTDEAMFHAVNRRGGQSLRVGAPVADTFARTFIPSPAALRQMIGRAAE